MSLRGIDQIHIWDWLSNSPCFVHPIEKLCPPIQQSFSRHLTNSETVWAWYDPNFCLLGGGFCTSPGCGKLLMRR